MPGDENWIKDGMEQENSNCKMLEATYLSLEDIDQQFINQWCELESCAVEDNAYLSPYFILPAIRYLSGKKNIYIAAVFSTSSNEKRLCGLGVFNYCKGNWAFPLPHMIAFKSVHSFLSGLLIDKMGAGATVEKLFSFLRSAHPRVYGVSFAELPQPGKLGELLMSQTGKNGVNWFEKSNKLRACLCIRLKVEEEGWDSHISSKRRKNYRRSIRGLSARGNVSWNLITGSEVTINHIDNFLRLEHAGWKSTQNSSLLSKQNHEQFFKEMVKGFFGCYKIFFSELVLNNDVIASTCNLIGGRTGFAFKIGWDAGLQEFSPGILNEMEFLKNVDASKLSIDEIDSGADESSFINSYWPQRKQLVSGIFSFGYSAFGVLKIIDYLRGVKRALKQLQSKQRQGKQVKTSKNKIKNNGSLT